jgi:ABC-type transport system involved in multi-copper enzyme maturation permease subunit
MKYLAILKDSVREAIDLKVFYVSVALSVLLSLLVLSVTYRPVTAEEILEEDNRLILNPMGEMKHPLMAKLNLEGVKHVSYEDFKRLDQGTEPWTGNYQFTLDLEMWESLPVVTSEAKAGDGKEPAGDAKPVPAKQPKITPRSLPLPLMMACKWTDNFKVNALPSTDPKHLRFDVETVGTKRGFRTRPEWIHQPGLFFGLWQLPIKLFKLEEIVRFIGNGIIGSFGAAVVMLLSCIVTAFFIPNMLAKGTVDLLLVKPINRVTLFIYKFLGGTAFMLLNTTVIMVGVWAGLGLQSGYWVNAFLLCIPIFAFEFMIFYSASALAGVLTRSPIVSILTVVFLWGSFSAVGWANWLAVERYKVQSLPSGEIELEPTIVSAASDHWAISLIEILHAMLPRYKDLDWLTAKEIKAELIKPQDLSSPALVESYRFQLQVLDREYGTYAWGPTIGVSVIFIVIVVSLATFWFATRDY